MTFLFVFNIQLSWKNEFRVLFWWWRDGLFIKNLIHILMLWPHRLFPRRRLQVIAARMVAPTVVNVIALPAKSLSCTLIRFQAPKKSREFLITATSRTKVKVYPGEAGTHLHREWFIQQYQDMRCDASPYWHFVKCSKEAWKVRVVRFGISSCNNVQNIKHIYFSLILTIEIFKPIIRGNRFFPNAPHFVTGLAVSSICDRSRATLLWPRFLDADVQKSGSWKAALRLWRPGGPRNASRKTRIISWSTCKIYPSRLCLTGDCKCFTTASQYLPRSSSVAFPLLSTDGFAVFVELQIFWNLPW